MVFPQWCFYGKKELWCFYDQGTFSKNDIPRGSLWWRHPCKSSSLPLLISWSVLGCPHLPSCLNIAVLANICPHMCCHLAGLDSSTLELPPALLTAIAAVSTCQALYAPILNLLVFSTTNSSSTGHVHVHVHTKEPSFQIRQCYNTSNRKCWTCPYRYSSIDCSQVSSQHFRVSMTWEHSQGLMCLLYFKLSIWPHHTIDPSLFELTIGIIIR